MAKISVIERAEMAHPLLIRLCERLPPPFCGELSALCCGAEEPEELRLRRGRPLALRCGERWYSGRAPLSGELLEELLSDFCEGALYAHRDSLADGYVTLRDGSRVGVCGRASVEDGHIAGVYDVSSLCIRLPGALPLSAAQAAEQIVPLLDEDCRSLLIYSLPGAGKTTLLRALALRLACQPGGRQVAVVDSRCELTPHLQNAGGTLDLLTGYPRERGIEIALRTLGAEVILCDEIGSRADAAAILDALACGVPLIATAHGSELGALRRRPALAMLFEAEAFSAGVGLARDYGSAECTLTVTRL